MKAYILFYVTKNFIKVQKKNYKKNKKIYYTLFLTEFLHEQMTCGIKLAI